MKNPVFTGAGVAIITPMYEDGSINFDELFLVGHGGALAGGAADDDGIGAMGDLVINDAAQFFKVYAAIGVHRGDNGNRSAGKNRLLHREYSFF